MNTPDPEIKQNKDDGIPNGNYIVTNPLEKLFDRILPNKQICNCEGDVYLRRWYLWRSTKASLFLHKFVRSDEDRANHDHPFAFIVLPFWRGYYEHREKVLEDGTIKHSVHRIYPFFGLRYRPATFRHRVELKEGKTAWSLFLRFERKKTWGFYVKGRFVDHKQWWADNCGED